MENRIQREPVNVNCTVLYNKNSISKECRCPCCGAATEKILAKVEAEFVYWLYNTFDYCPKCRTYYIGPNDLRSLLTEAKRRFPKAPEPFFVPSNIFIIPDEENRSLFIPKGMVDKELFNRKNLPARNEGYYEPTNEEYDWILKQFASVPFSNPKLKGKSIIAKEGYSSGLEEEKRHLILENCALKYGKERVISSLDFNITMRIRQTDGKNRFAQAISTWENDIQYVKKLMQK